MNQILLFIGLVIILCLTIKPVGKKLPFPTLLIFIALGMLLGVNGPTHIDFSDYALTETVCSTALLFIMFYGGFNTNIDRAKPVAAPAVLLSTPRRRHHCRHHRRIRPLCAGFRLDRRPAAGIGRGVHRRGQRL